MRTDNLLIYLTKQDLTEIVQQAVRTELNKQQPIIEQPKPKTAEGLMKRKEVAAFFGVSLTTVDIWAKKKVLPKPIKKASRIYYRRAEIEAVEVQ
jgi:predicted DNA-binding transcriptional regulator AlpA